MGSLLKKLNSKLHLWLGLLSGIVVFIVCITGCLYAFKDEINELREPWKFIEPRDTPRMEPSQLMEIAEREEGFNPSSTSALMYYGADQAAKLDYFSREGSTEIHIDPYTGEIVRVVRHEPGEFDFFRWVLNGHRTLWLPRKIGKPVVGIGVLVFLITLITGMVLWWPRKWNRKSARNNFTIPFKGPWHRVNWKLHNVLGGYAFIVLTICCLTGLVWSFNGFSKGVYYVTSGGKEMQPYTMPQSDTTHMERAVADPVDSLFRQLSAREPGASSFYFALPRNPAGTIRVNVGHKKNARHYWTDNLFFDRYTLEPLEGSGPYAGKYRELSGADKLRRMNLDLHDGRILGLPGQILAFTGSLIGASLPVTGVIIWLRKGRNRRRRKSRP